MNNKSSLFQKAFKVIIVFLFIAFLLFGRYTWLQLFNHTSEAKIQDGQIDLTDLDFSNDMVISLNGEWAFYPYTFSDEKNMPSKKVWLKVPSDWGSALNPDTNSSYGYGTYHLRIHVDPEVDIAYALRIPSVRSASQVYANGQFVGSSGKVGKTSDTANDFNVPYTTSSIRSDENGIIDIVIHGSNYQDPRKSGIIRSLKFGSEDKLVSQTHLSLSLQITITVIFGLFILFSCIVYFVGWKDRRLLYFALLLFALMCINLLVGDEKLLIKVTHIPYNISYKMVNIIGIIAGLSLIQCYREQITRRIPWFLTIYTVSATLFIALWLLLPNNLLGQMANYTMVFGFISLSFTIIMSILSYKEIQGSLLFFLTLLTFAHHGAWFFYLYQTGIKLIFYPFDLIIGLILLAAFWLKQYYKTFKRTEAYAQKLEQQDQLKDEFLLNTSHELRNPLHGIINLSDAVLIREKENLQQKSVEELETVCSVGQRMNLMINDLMDVMSIEHNQPSLHSSHFSIHQVIDQTFHLLVYMTEGKEITLQKNVPSDFPLVYADKNKVAQIVFNLVHNALKFTTKGTITVQAEVKKKSAVIKVIDTGRGIEENALQEIFQPYHQEQNVEGGFGLGLSLSQKLVELHGGHLKVQSDVGIGSTFCFTLPLSQIQNKEGTKVAQHELHSAISKPQFVSVPKATANTLSDKHILLVDDDPINLKVIQSILSNEPYHLTAVLNASDAMNLLNKRHWDLVISDVMMPNMNGYELTKKIRERFSVTDLPILLLTARSREQDIYSGFLAGANDYVTKPIAAIEFKSRVKNLIDIKHSTQQRLHMETAWHHAQIRPHFIFNTLNTIMALSEIDIARMQRLLDAFNTILRKKFSFQDYDDLTTLEEELTFIESYLYIEQERFGERVHIQWDIADKRDIVIPSLALQTIVENAIRHGILKKEDGGIVLIQTKVYDAYIEIIVKDDGVGMTQETIDDLLTGNIDEKQSVGLRNTDIRLKRMFGEGLHIESILEKGTTVRFKIFFD